MKALKTVDVLRLQRKQLREGGHQGEEKCFFPNKTHISSRIRASGLKILAKHPSDGNTTKRQRPV